MTTTTHPRPGANAKSPTFALPTLQALASWRHALAAREEWRGKLAAATTPIERSTAVQGIDRCSREIVQAERAVRGSLLAEVTP